MYIKKEISKISKRVGTTQGFLYINKKLPNNLYEATCICNKIIKCSIKQLAKKRSCGCKSTNKPITNLARVFRDYKERAARRGKEFILTFEEWQNFTQQPCHYCGIPPKLVSANTFNKGLSYNGIDRINNLKGYTKENCVPCCAFCNMAKSRYTVSTFLDNVDKIYHFQHHQNKIGYTGF